MHYLILTLSILFIVSCGSQNGADTPFKGKPGIEGGDPLPQNGSTVPSTSTCIWNATSQTYQSGSNFILESKIKDGHHWAAGGGCLHKNIRENWAVSHSADFFKWKEADLDGVSKVETTVAPFLFQVNYSAGPAVFKQKWLMEFYQLFTGEIKDPKKIQIDYQKTKGTKYIEFWKGKITLDFLNADTTSFHMENETQGTQIDDAKARGAISDLYHNMQDGKPNWDYIGK